MSVKASKTSSQVPKPPGKNAIAPASFTRKSFRVKKYLNVMSFGSEAIHGFASCSKGSRMLRPKLRSPPAPACAAPMIPAPAPVTTIQSCSTMRRPNVTAATEAGSPAGVRADPNTVTFGTSAYGAKTLNEYRSSLRAVFVILRSPRSEERRVGKECKYRWVEDE